MGMNLIHWLQGHIVQRVVRDVPPEMAACEFECRRDDCQAEEWAACPNRKRIESGGS